MKTREKWEANAPSWTELARAGYDIYRDAFNTPAFLEMLPDLTGLHGLDIGCGEGHNTRLLAALDPASVTAVDHAVNFAQAAAALGKAAYLAGDALQLPFADATFDFATAFMSLMDTTDPARALEEAARILKPGGFLQFSLTHPCFTTPHRRNLKRPDGTTRAIEVGDYFREGARTETWLFSAAPADVRARHQPFTIPSSHATLSTWFACLRGAGLTLEDLREPRPDAEALARYPRVQDATVVAFFLHIRARKPSVFTAR
jgi:SAM-dependent methyltransferase